MSTYSPIATFTVSSATGGLSTPITFSSIPQGYTDLVIVINGKVTSGASMYLRFNGDAGNNYSWTYLRGTGSAAESGRDSNRELSTWSVWRTTNIQYGILQIQNYSNATTNKTYLSRSYDDNGFVYAYTSLWRNTSPITSIQFLCDTNYAVGTTFSLYGIQVGNSAQKAQGGNIVTSDGTYVYHTFTSSGSFIPSQALTVDYLVVAGGGSGGSHNGGGGGAGGLRSTVTATGGGGSLESALSLSSGKSYPVIVGAGGPAVGTPSTKGVSGSNSVFATITSTGGGGGGSYFVANYNGLSGGSGGGGSLDDPNGRGTAGSGTANQGYAGGLANSNLSTYSAGGGGGAGGVGQVGTGSVGGAGGVGVSVSISGSSVTYAGGGGGSDGDGSGGAGGSGIGGSGTGGSGNGTAGVINTGSGGGSAGFGTSGAGGSGIVIIRYAI